MSRKPPLVIKTNGGFTATEIRKIKKKLQDYNVRRERQKLNFEKRNQFKLGRWLPKQGN